MATLLLITCLTVALTSGRKIHTSPESFYHYNHASNPDPHVAWNFGSYLPNNGIPAIDVVPSRPDYNNEDTVWHLSPLEYNNKDYLYDYVGDNWMLGEEDNPFYYYTEGRTGEKNNKKAGKEEMPKHRTKYRRLRSLANNRKTENALHNSLEARSTRKAPRFVPNKLKRAVTRNVLRNIEKVQPKGGLQSIPSMTKRDTQLETSAPAGQFQMKRLSRRKRQVKAHQLEYFTDDDGNSQFHAPGKTEGTEWDLVPLEALKDDNEEQLGIQYDKKDYDVALLTSE